MLGRWFLGHRRALGAAAGLAVLVGGVGLYAAGDLLLSALPFPLGAVVTLGYGLLVAATGYSLLAAEPVRVRAVLAFLAVVTIGGIHLADTNSRKPFRRDLERIQPGMSIAEVDHIMAPYLRSPQTPGQVSERGEVGYRHTTEGWGDSDIGLVTFRDGTVLNVRFLLD